MWMVIGFPLRSSSLPVAYNLGSIADQRAIWPIPLVSLMFTLCVQPKLYVVLLTPNKSSSDDFVVKQSR